MINQVTILEYALLANDVYSNVEPPERRMIPLNRDAHSQYGKWHDITSSITDMHLHFYSSLFARLYVRKIGSIPNAAVLAYRGTIPTKAGNLADDTELTIHFDPEDDPRAKAFFILAHNYVIRLGLHLRLTGHSLGGAFAQLVAVASRLEPETVTFNSPGIGQIMGIEDTWQYPYIHNINAEHGVINKVGKTIGDITWIVVPEGDGTITKSDKTLRHDMDHLHLVGAEHAATRYASAVIDQHKIAVSAKSSPP